MRRSRRLRLAYIFAWIILLGAAFLFAFERSGLLTEAVRERVARQLGPLGEGLEIGDARISLLTPSLELDDVRLTSPETGRVLLELRHVEVHASFPPSRIEPIDFVRIDGGRVRVGDELLGELQRILASVAPGEPEDEGPEMQLPGAVLRRMDVLLELPSTGGEENLLELGRLNLAARPANGGELRVTGELLPWLNGATRRSESIAFEGTRIGDVFAIEARTRGLAVSSERFIPPPVLAALPLEAFAGRLDVDARVAVGLQEVGTGLSVSLRAQLEEGGLTFTGHAPLVDAEVQIAGGMDVPPGGQLWARDSWMAHSRVDARWLDGPITSFGSFGRAAPPDSLMLIGAYAPNFPLADPEVERLISNVPGVDELRSALQPSGQVAVTIATTFPMPRPNTPTLQPPTTFVRFGFDGRAGIEFAGFRRRLPDGTLDLESERAGFPVPLEVVRGAVVVHDDPERPSRTRVVLRDIETRAIDAHVEVEGTISSRREGSQVDGMDLLVNLVRLEVGDEVRRALDGHPGTREIWEEYAPVGGSITGSVRVASDEAYAGTVAHVALGVRDIGATWRELPVPVRGASGSIDVRWAPVPAAVLSEGFPFRASGARVRLTTDEEAGDGLGLDVRFRQDEPPESGLPPRLGVEVELDRLLLRGERWRDLAVQFPDVAEVVGELGASGGVGVRYRGSRPRPKEPYVHVTEVVPGDPLVLRPDVFPRTTRGLRGRVLVRNEDHADDVSRGLTRWQLAAVWPDGVDLYSEGRAPFEGDGRALVVAAGIDPANETFRGALRVATSDPDGSSSIDLTENAVEGRLDARLFTTLPGDEEREPQLEASVWLRGNTLRNDSIELGGLSGELVQSGDVFRAERVDAELRGHPIVLEDVMLFPLALAEILPEADPMLDRERLDPNGVGLQAKLTTEDLPLDETHLEDLLSTEALEWIRNDPDWSGLLDLERAQLVLTSEEDGSGKLALYGRAVVHDMTLRPGLAISVDELRADVRELVVEAGRIRMWGEVDDLAGSIESRPLENASMIVSYLDGRLNVDNLDGAFCGGRLRSAGSEAGGASTALAADLGEPYGFDLRLVLDDVEADSLLRGVFQSSVADQGTIDAALFLRGKPSDILGIRGNGWVSVDEAQLYSIPVIRELFGALGFDDQAVFDRMRTRFQWRDGKIHMNDITVRSALLKLVGEGWLALDGQLHHDLEVRYSLVDRLGPLSWIVYWINNALVRVRIRGDMDRPVVAIESLIRELFGSDRPTGRSLPLPPFAELDARF
ncbi:MAG: AsmA-like C-terminal region-containing protein [Planctomycetota bacterium]